MKKQYISNTGIAFLVTGVLLFIYTWWKDDHMNGLDINLSNTYIVVGYAPLGIAFSLVLFVFGGVYFLFQGIKKPLHNGLAYVHSILSFIGLGLFFRIHLRPSRRISGTPNLEAVSFTITLGLGIFCIGILLLLINIIHTLVRKKRSE